MAFDFSTLITDRSQGDLDALRDLLNTPISDWTAEQLAEFNQAVSKGAYNYTDLNRVTEAMDYINNQLVGYGYQTGYQRVEVPHNGGSMLPDGYTQVEYIQSSGTQYIDTGFNPNQDSELSVTMQLTTAPTNDWPFGVRKSAGVDVFGAMFSSATSVVSWFGTASVTQTITDVTQKFSLTKNGTTTTLSYSDGTEYTITNQAATFQSDYSLFLLNINLAGSPASARVSAKLWGAELYSDQELVRHFVPCTDTSGEVGLYDIVGEKFYGNSGTGLFIAGPEVPNTPDPSLDPYMWYESDDPTKTQMEAYLANVEALRSTLDVLESTPQTPESMDALTWAKANDIEQILIDIQFVIDRVVKSFSRSNAYTFWSGNRPLPS